MTKRQMDVLDAIRAFVGRHGYSPTLEDIGGEIGVTSPATVHKHVSALERDGHIRRRHNQGRSIVLVSKAQPGEARDALIAAARELEQLGYAMAAEIVRRRIKAPLGLELGQVLVEKVSLEEAKRRFPR